MPVSLNTEEAFNNAIKRPSLTVIHFQAAWADQCTQVNELLDTLAKQVDFASVKFYSCPAEELSEIAIKYNIESVPTVLLFQLGEKVDRVDGADAPKITETVRLHISKSEGENKTESIDDKLKALINKDKVMLFMKGDRVKPRCGFSRQIIEILNSTGVSYSTFDILQDEEVRQSLKVYSDWPTYPQLYIKGELIGGLDIVKEMMADGSLATSLV
uniref:Uncharacterized protein n=1 Tax=Dendroctonus ponderosae TaxID=77166 RepID=J3JX56_DENPD|nr:unknown [Dendroctonus ponderosae]